ncbi:MAG: magnesium transport protein CorA [Burkholderiales bacterium]|nr:MAG: magnesium transport protein CorA [Burkholderiales bacterium]
MLINCVAYQDGRKLADLPVERISDYLVKPGGFVWVALKDPTPQELSQMQEEFNLHELAVEDARHGHQRPKIEEYGDSLFVVLQVIEMRDDGELTVGEVDIFVGSNYVLSIRSGAERGFQDVRARCEREPELLRYGAGFVLYALMDSVVDRYFPIVGALEDELERIEERIFQQSTPARRIIEDLYSLKHRLMIVQHAVAPLLEAVSKLHGGRTPPVCGGMQEYFRDVSDHLLRMLRTIEGRREMLNTVMQVNLAMITLAENEVMKRLASYAALFAVPTMIAGIYGMNFRHMPELDWTFGYPLVLAVMAGADALLWRRFKKAGWL